jgi:hypothetical protein
MTMLMPDGPAGDARADGPWILLVSPDLLSTSRIAGLARDAGGRLETLRSLDDPPPGGPFQLVLLDLQALPGDPAVLVSRVLAVIESQRSRTGCAAKLVAFGPHVAKDRLDQAKAAGADAAVSRGELLGGFIAILRRWG